jgi:hypothetical protein
MRNERRFPIEEGILRHTSARETQMEEARSQEFNEDLPALEGVTSERDNFFLN